MPKTSIHPDTINFSKPDLAFQRRSGAPTPNMRLKAPHEHIRRDFEEDIWYEEDCERDIGLVALELQILLKSQCQSIGDVDSIQEGCDVEQEEDGNDSKVNLADEGSLVDRRWAFNGHGAWVAGGRAVDVGAFCFTNWVSCHTIMRLSIDGNKAPNGSLTGLFHDRFGNLSSSASLWGGSLISAMRPALKRLCRACELHKIGTL
jgi:hypothetical protein